jgi:hypothetical protein
MRKREGARIGFGVVGRKSGHAVGGKRPVNGARREVHVGRNPAR